jgi:hypothetical protein
MSDIQQFDPTDYSIKENEFLLEHLGEPTVVALRAVPQASPLAKPFFKDKNPVNYPQGINPAAIRPILDRINELQQLEKHESVQWVGVEKIKAAIRVFLRENAKWSDDHKRTKGRAPRWPSLSSFDAKGRPHRGGPGSDAGKVRTYFGPAGERIPFAVDLMTEYIAKWDAPGHTEAPSDARLFVDATANRIECRVKVGDGICGHTEKYKPEARASYTAARARMSKHLRRATENVEEHRELHTEEFGE